MEVGVPEQDRPLDVHRNGRVAVQGLQLEGSFNGAVVGDRDHRVEPEKLLDLALLDSQRAQRAERRGPPHSREVVLDIARAVLLAETRQQPRRELSA
ncbi:MAG: hypothetical protein OXN89_04105 [Bryobacterales bacterium]|nr:hypothetical protein [Bryobacterales bacterium]